MVDEAMREGGAAATSAGDQPQDNSQEERSADQAPLVVQDSRGRFATHGRLTKKQADFADALAMGIPQVEAAKRAGYEHSVVEASRLKKNPAVQARVREMLQRRLQRGASLAIKVVEDILTGKIEAPASVRLDAAKHVQRVAGIDGGAEKDKGNKSLREMTLAELEALADAFRGKGSQGTVPTGTGDGAQVIDVEVESTT